jgi:16S rRNA processing protein RimM
VARAVAPSRAPPADLVELGRVSGAYGVKGWVRIAPHAADGDVLGAVSEWWLIDDGDAKSIQVAERRRQQSEWRAKWPGCESKEAADALKGAKVAVARSRFPALEPGAYYLTDLVGSAVVNRDGQALGTIGGLRSSEVAGVVRQWLEVEDGESMLLIPLVGQYVDEVDAARRVVRVDWQRDW